MTAVIGALRVVLGADTAAFEKGLSGAQKTLNQFGRRMERLSANVAGLGQTLTLGLTLPIIAFGAASVRSAQEAADAMGQVEAALKSMGSASGKTLGDLDKQATRLMKSSLFDDDDILRSVTANLLTFGSIAGNEFDRAQQAAVDLATRMQMELQPATLLVGKALNAPRAGLKALGRAGIQFSDEQKKLIEGFVKTGRVARAQQIILGELERQFGGAAQAAQDANKFDGFRDALDDLTKIIGDRLLPILTPLVNAMTRIMESFSRMGPFGQTLTLVLAGVAAAAGPLLLVTAALINAMGVLAVSMGRTGAVGGVLGATFARLAVAMSALSLANLRTVFSTTALTAAFMGQSTAMALLAATGRTLAVVFMSLGRGLLALVGGPIGLAIIAIAALVMNIGKADRENKKLIETMGGASGALDEYEQAALAAATATGENRKEAIKNAAAMRQEALDAIKAARALRERTAALAADLAAVADRRAADARSDTGRSAALGVRSGIYEGAQAQADAARAKADAAAKAVSAAEKRLKEIETNINAVVKAANAGADAIGDIADTTKKAKKEATDYAAELEAMRRSLAAPTQQAITDTTDKIALLTEGLKAGKYTAYEVAQALRMINEALDRDKFGDAVAKIDQGADLEDGPPKVVTFGGRVMSEETAEDLRQQMTDTFRGALDALRGGGVEGVFRYLADSFANRLLDRLANDLTTLLDQILTQIGSAGGGSGGGIGAFLSTVFGGGGGPVPGFATGGSFKVGGSGGIDSQLMQFRATPGEMVDVRHGNDNGGRRATNVFDMRGAVVTQDLLNQMNSIAAQGDMQVIGAIQKERTREQQAIRYRVAR